jgi:hypothetical protein
MIFVDFIFFSWLQILLCSFFFKLTLLQSFPVWFLFCYSISPHVFFSKLFLSIFFNIELIENLALTFPTCFFFHFFFKIVFFIFLCFFSRIVFVDFIFLI